MKKSDHLPVYGVGPLCVYLMVGLLILAIVFKQFGFLASGEVPNLKIPMRILGVILIAFGVFMWIPKKIAEVIWKKINWHNSLTLENL